MVTANNNLKSLRWRMLALASSALLAVVVAVCLLIQPDWLAPVSLVPAWGWLMPGLTLLAFGFCWRYRLIAIAVFFLWVFFAGVFVEESRSLIRRQKISSKNDKLATQQGRAVRIISLNCAGDSRAAKEVAQWNPDIILLQESPSEKHVAQLTRDLFGEQGHYLHGIDTSILARGEILVPAQSQESHFIYAHVKLTNGLQVNVVSIRLSPPVFRLDFWSPRFWVEHRDKRIKHREQIQTMMKHVATTCANGPLIVGGDLNSPPHDAHFWLCSHDLVTPSKKQDAAGEQPARMSIRFFASIKFGPVTIFKSIVSSHEKHVTRIIEWLSVISFN